MSFSRGIPKTKASRMEGALRPSHSSLVLLHCFAVQIMQAFYDLDELFYAEAEGFGIDYHTLVLDVNSRIEPGIRTMRDPALEAFALNDEDRI
jgi:hypothetical protein